MNLFIKHKDSVDNFNRYFNMFKNLGFLVTAISGFVSKLFENEHINKFITDKIQIPEFIVEKIVDTQGMWIIAFSILVIITLFKFLYNAITAKANNIKNMLLLLKMIHLDFIHDIRTKIVVTDVLLPNRLKEAQKNDEDINIIYNQELEKLKANIQPYVDILGKYLTRYRNLKISVCVKTFTNGQMNKSDYMNEELITIARSSNTKNCRNYNHKSLVKNNTDFIDLCCGKSSFFGRANLKKLYDAELYKNDTPRWWKQYNSTLVAPIRYYNKDGINKNLNIDIDVLGFLCIDCKENILEWENSNSFELQLLAIVADSLYSYMRVFYNCFEDIKYFVRESK